MYNKQNPIVPMSQFKRRLLRLPLLSIALLGMYSSYAQSDWKASVGGQMSFAELRADESTLNTSTDPGAGFNLGISYGLNESWSLHSGIGISYIETSNNSSNYSDQAAATDFEGENFEFRYRLENYSERQKSTMLSIPVGVQYESKGSQTRFYSKAGASVNVFLSPKVEGRANRLTTSGYFERFNAVLTAPAFAGFGTFDEIQFSENDLDIKNSFNAFLEIGVKEKFGSNNWVYIGLFAEYGLNDLLENNNSNLIEYNQNTPTDFINNSSLNSTIGNAPLFDKVTLNMIGLRVKYEFGI